MIFSGQGAQWPGMGKELIATDPEFRKDIFAMDRILQGLKYPPDWTIESKESSSWHDRGFSHALQVSLRSLPKAVKSTGPT